MYHTVLYSVVDFLSDTGFVTGRCAHVCSTCEKVKGVELVTSSQAALLPASDIEQSSCHHKYTDIRIKQSYTYIYRKYIGKTVIERIRHLYKFRDYSLRGFDNIEEETDRREDKGRRCYFGDGIHSIPFRT